MFQALPNLRKPTEMANPAKMAKTTKMVKMAKWEIFKKSARKF